ncbi:MAG: SufS family cysteine desulfurase [Chloroflexota bacterium]
MKPLLNATAIREDFPILKRLVHGRPLIYLDNAATSQKPQVVIDKLVDYYTNYNSNIHRGVHFLSQRATEEYEKARKTLQKFLHAKSYEEIIFTRGTTEAINLVAATWGRQNVGEGDEIILTAMEHHSNIVPWQLLAQEKRAKLKVVPIDDDGRLMVEEYENLITDRTKIISLVHISNSLGTINPIADVIKLAHSRGIKVLIDAAQSAHHVKIDVQKLDCDFLAVSGHKMYGPTGIGALYAKRELLESMPPYQGGGDMIKSVKFEKTIYNDLPYKFEAGTPNIAGAIGFGAAIDYIKQIGLDTIAAYEAELLRYATEVVESIEGLTVIGKSADKASVLAFVMEGIHPHDIGTILDVDGIAIRTGHHCTEPVMCRFNVPATARASFAFYNTKEEIDALGVSLQKLKRMFG